MGNGIFSSEICKTVNCYNQKFNIKRSETINIDELPEKYEIDKNNLLKNEDSNEQAQNPKFEENKGETEEIEHKISRFSSLNDVNSSKSNQDKIKNSLQEANNFSNSLLNQDIIEEFNINENKYLYDFFFVKIFDEINRARTNLLSYSKLLVKYSNEIKTDENNINYLLSNDKKIHFVYDKEDFLICAKELEKLDDELKKKNTSLKKFVYIEEMKFPLPKKLSYDISKDFIKKNFETFKNKFKHKYDIKKLSNFSSTKDPEVAILIEIIYDIKRRNKYLLSENIRYVNMDFRSFKGLIMIFITFAK
jgi:hypothetical protein